MFRKVAGTELPATDWTRKSSEQMASPAFRQSEPRTEKYFKVPNEFAENQHAFIPAERALALIIWRDARNTKGFTDMNGTAQVSDQQWTDWTGLKPRMKELAIRGLKDKGLEVNGEGSKAKFSWNWNRWSNAFIDRPEPSNYDPKRKERDAKAAASRVHPDCATGCARLREMAAKDGGSNQATPLLVMPVAQPVAQVVSKPASQKPGSLAEKEVKWALTLAAMRTQFASVGVDLLVRLLAVLVSFVKLNLSDYVLAEAVKEAYADSRGRWNSPILLLKTVPEVLKGWKAKGQPMDDPGDPEGYTYLSERKKEPPPDPPEKPKRPRARDLV